MLRKRLHIALGTIGLILFALQGQYMARILGVPDLPDVERLLYRSAHIYFMLACLANIAVGVYSTPTNVHSLIRKLTSFVLLVTPVMLFVSFFWETTPQSIDRPMLSSALYLLFGSGVLLLLESIWEHFRKEQT